MTRPTTEGEAYQRAGAKVSERKREFDLRVVAKILDALTDDACNRNMRTIETRVGQNHNQFLSYVVYLETLGYVHVETRPDTDRRIPRITSLGLEARDALRRAVHLFGLAGVKDRLDRL